MNDSETHKTQDPLGFSKETLVISGNRKLYVFKFNQEPAADSQASSTGNISLEGTKTDD